MLNNKIPPVVVVVFFAAVMALIAHYTVIDFTAFIADVVADTASPPARTKHSRPQPPTY